ncbi:proteasome subunit alpha type-2-like [Rhodnius prolixus]|uniref:proteasome subunit alpha type-2-like n=1 Tax=Rhodnius prolixus TaxID=13249 RepID=UPI003D18DDAF
MRVIARGFLPFGVTLLFSGWYDCKQTLFQCDPSVAYYAWKAIAIGKNYSNETTFLEISFLYSTLFVDGDVGGVGIRSKSAALNGYLDFKKLPFTLY